MLSYVNYTAFAQFDAVLYDVLDHQLDIALVIDYLSKLATYEQRIQFEEIYAFYLRNECPNPLLISVKKFLWLHDNSWFTINFGDWTEHID